MAMRTHFAGVAVICERDQVREGGSGEDSGHRDAHASRRGRVQTRTNSRARHTHKHTGTVMINKDLRITRNIPDVISEVDPSVTLAS